MKHLLLAALLCLPVIAQDAKPVTLRLLAFPKSEDTSPVELLLGDSTIEVELASNRLSDPYKVPAQAKWSFGKTTEGTGKERKFKVYGAGKSKKSPSQIVILFRLGPKNSDGFRVVSYMDGPKKFGDRQLFFLNLTNEPVAGDVGAVKFALKPAQHTVISPKQDQGPDLCHASLLLQKNGGWHPFMSTNWPLKEKTRGLIFIYGDPVTSKVRLHSIRDFL